jgi:hypothetical protein
MVTVAKALLVVGAVYLALVAVLYLTQTRALFPTGLVGTSGAPLPATAVPLALTTPDGVRLQGLWIPPAAVASAPTPTPTLILGFGGNAWHGDDVAAYLHGLFPGHHVASFHYRGYPPSTGTPSAAALLADAPRVFDHAVAQVRPARVVAVGFSIGAGVAAALAAERRLDGMILVSPFDSLAALARAHYPWAPVGWLLRHHMEPAAALRGLDAPVAVIAAERDTIIPPARTAALRAAIANLAFERIIAGADHNDLYDRADFRAAMVEALARIESSAATQPAAGGA